MSDAVKGLKPAAVWRYFDEISAIPRPSKREEAVVKYLEKWAKQRKLKCKKDDAGNVVIYIPASAGFEKSPTAILQAHMDMVCEKNRSVEFDFLKEGIKLVRDGGKLRAEGTTLGADNGVGVAAALAAAESETPHPPLELLFTSDEETGMTGAFGLDASLLKGKLLLNLDTEEFGYIYVGCAGGANVDAHFPLKYSKAEAGYIVVDISLEGLKGGHSGCDIEKKRGNAAQLLARVLLEAVKTLKARVVSLEAGDKHNAIPREAFAKIIIPKSKLAALQKLADAMKARFVTELAKGHNLSITLVKSDEKPTKAQDLKLSLNALSALLAIPSGPIAMSAEIPGLVETSNNVSVVRTTQKALVAQCMPRSSVESEQLHVIERVRAIAALAGGRTENESSYPGWKPDVESRLVKTAEAVGERMFGKKFAVTAIHAGLECGVIGTKIPGLDKISIGPDIKNPHSPDEFVDIASVEKFYDYLLGLLEELAKG